MVNSSKVVAQNERREKSFLLVLVLQVDCLATATVTCEGRSEGYYADLQSSCTRYHLEMELLCLHLYLQLHEATGIDVGVLVHRYQIPGITVYATKSYLVISLH